MAKHPVGLPSRQQILDFITTSDQPAGKREIARAFGLKGTAKIALKALLKDMADEGLIDSAPGRAFHKMGGVPRVTVIRIVDIDGDQPVGVPESWHAEGRPPPRIRIIERASGGRAARGGRPPALGVGDRILARTEEKGSGIVAHVMKRLARGEELKLGVLREEPAGRFWLKPVDKRERRDWPVSDPGDAAAGELVLAELTGRPPRITARVTERLGDPFAPRSVSLIAIHRLGIPHVFPDEVVEQADNAAKMPLGEGREDLRDLPIVAIDPRDARDYDDAIWATPDDDPANPGGYRAIVAIADVSYFVRPGSAVDREARKRGNSVYFPDRVVPMLPKPLSADACSLRAGTDKAALACHLVIDAKGLITRWRFSRALVRIAANIPYQHAQAAIDGTESHELTEIALRPLWACWRLLDKARTRREPLDLELPERRIELDAEGRITSIAVRERLDAHRVVEEYMIAANVAAAKALEAKKAPVMYRDHEPPSREKLVALRDYLKTFGIDFALGQVISPATFNRVIARVGEAEYRPQVMEQVLRSQTQAYYAPQNTGHFGLSLGSYAHFTSPIRRYSDLIVHRALVGAYGLGDGALTNDEAGRMTAIGTAISLTERRAMEAERETVDRYVAAFLSTRIGEIVEARITGVQSFGFFATVEGLGGDGLVPVGDLGPEYFRYDEASISLTGTDSGTVYSPGKRLSLRLAEADPVSGALRFELPGQPGSQRPRGNGPRRPVRRRGR